MCDHRIITTLSSLYYLGLTLDPFTNLPSYRSPGGLKLYRTLILLDKVFIAGKKFI
ncbi:MAG: hypothetical protein ACMUJM_00690 [bacterium]